MKLIIAFKAYLKFCDKVFLLEFRGPQNYPDIITYLYTECITNIRHFLHIKCACKISLSSWHTLYAYVHFWNWIRAQCPLQYVSDAQFSTVIIEIRYQRWKRCINISISPEKHQRWPYTHIYSVLFYYIKPTRIPTPYLVVKNMTYSQP